MKKNESKKTMYSFYGGGIDVYRNAIKCSGG